MGFLTRFDGGQKLLDHIWRAVRRSHPRLLLVLLICLPFSLPAFFVMVSFLAAATPEQAAAKGSPPLPPGWSAGVLNHGRYYEWWTIAERPVLFWGSLVVLVGTIGLLFGLVILALIDFARKGNATTPDQ